MKRDDDSRIDWLLAWIGADLQAMPPGALLDLRAAVLARLHEPTKAAVTPGGPSWAALKPAVADNADATVQAARALLQAIQADLRAGIAALAAGRPWFPFPLDEGGPGWSLEPVEGGTVRAYMGEWRAVTLATAADLLGEWWGDLRVCARPGCGRWFRPLEKRMRYHDPKCSALVRWSRYSPKRDTQKEKERRVLGKARKRVTKKSKERAK